jgi:hypothetical protein
MFKWFGKVNFVPYTKVTEFGRHLRSGRLMASRCKSCGTQSFPPRADCAECLSGEFEFVEITGRGIVYTFSKIFAAPTGFESLVPYTIGVVDLEEGGRALAWFGESIPEADVRIGLPVQMVPQFFDEAEEIKIYYSFEREGTTWKKAPVEM